MNRLAAARNSSKASEERRPQRYLGRIAVLPERRNDRGRSRGRGALPALGGLPSGASGGRASFTYIEAQPGLAGLLRYADSRFYDLNVLLNELRVSSRQGSRRHRIQYLSSRSGSFPQLQFLVVVK